jgi:hypothetical protein
MTIFPQRIGAISAFTARLLEQSREPDHLQKRATAPERFEAGCYDAQHLTSEGSTNCVDPGPAGFDFSEDELRRVLNRNNHPQK